MKRKEFEKYLNSMNCFLLREGGSHSIWQNKTNNKQTSVPRHSEIVNITCKVICKQLEIQSPVK
ncbi:MAG: type II toxin-antitoxin system HicA family toxin [Candidatus Kapabacteria bacterium]|nr:type II toxin-antitoxin system HicA family toxin [Candidatus Kapabacteria bacterium]